ncbi:hypothetical protein [Bradyrhizobium sp. Rc2d]|uniref:hypothetical protein n=1 Tax=Bradyrhizobium sp. Rc2d TaxID=1855321 RepID=UPI00115FAC6B|nr:hypothetical protein [Bradyrhizobium sp. Rc2d]
MGENPRPRCHFDAQIGRRWNVFSNRLTLALLKFIKRFSDRKLVRSSSAARKSLSMGGNVKSTVQSTVKTEVSFEEAPG